MEALGPLLIVLSIPLLFRWVPRNRFYGFRIVATLRNDSVWYDVNALSARHMITLGVLMVALEFLLPLSTRIPVLRAVGLIGIVAIIVADWRTANRWARERGVTSCGPSVTHEKPQDR
jgi:uncharacterized membrane protein